MSLSASQAGEPENRQTNDPEHTIVSSILKDLIFRRKSQKNMQFMYIMYQYAKMMQSMHRGLG